MTKEEEHRGRKVYSLSQLAQSLQSVISKAYSASYFIRAEIVKLNYYPSGGHCFPLLAEKDGDTILAQFRGVIWSSNYQYIQKRFSKITGATLQDDMKVLIEAKVIYDPQYGLTLNILDIDPSYTLGDILMSRNESLKKLESLGLTRKNRLLPTPVLPYRIAIISAEKGAGYRDFIEKLAQHTSEHCLQADLLPAVLQGKNAPESIIRKLREAEAAGTYDLVLIIRGGGDELGLNCYDYYKLAATIGELGIPVITGIGHSTNETLSEICSHKNCLTPTDSAVWLINLYISARTILHESEQKLIQTVQIKTDEEAKRLDRISVQINSLTQRRVEIEKKELEHLSLSLLKSSNTRQNKEKEKLESLSVQIRSSVRNNLFIRQQGLLHSQQNLIRISSSFLTERNQQLELIQMQLSCSDPARILRRGYSITYQGNTVIRHTAELKTGEEIRTIISSGEIISTIQQINIESNE